MRLLWWVETGIKAQQSCLAYMKYENLSFLCNWLLTHDKNIHFEVLSIALLPPSTLSHCLACFSGCIHDMLHVGWKLHWTQGRQGEFCFSALLGTGLQRSLMSERSQPEQLAVFPCWKKAKCLTLRQALFGSRVGAHARNPPLSQAFLNWFLPRDGVCSTFVQKSFSFNLMQSANCSTNLSYVPLWSWCQMVKMFVCACILSNILPHQHHLNVSCSSGLQLLIYNT